MLRLAGISFLCMTVFSSEATPCRSDFECMTVVDAQSKCTVQKRGPSCESGTFCTNPARDKDFQTCECKHLHNGVCMSETSKCGSVVTGVCPEIEGMTWECCANTL